MFQLIDTILHEFRSCFKYKATWCWFVVLIMGFMVRNNHRGITSIISALRLAPRLYHTMLHFFRSEGYRTEDLYKKWIDTVIKQDITVRISDRPVVAGDHIKISKEGRRMPGIITMKQESDNSGKAEYIEGHMYGHVCAIIDRNGTSRGLPLMTELQQSPPRIQGTNKPDGDTTVVQMVKLLHRTAIHMNESVIAALDAYFSKGTAFETASSLLTPDGRRWVEIVTRAQDNYVAYKKPIPPEIPKKGRPKDYGEKVVLRDMIKNNPDKAVQTTMTLYGKKTKVKYLCMDLLWKPLSKDTLIRFVAVESTRGKCVLMSTDLTLTPEEIIVIYALRFKIETSFNDQKNEVGCFYYRFWTFALPKRKRWGKKTDETVELSEADQRKIINTKKAMAAHVCLGTIATGILTIIAFMHVGEIWKRYRGWIKTIRTTVPSIAVVKDTLAQDLPLFLRRSSVLQTANIIKSFVRSDEFLYDELVCEDSDEAA